MHILIKFSRLGGGRYEIHSPYNKQVVEAIKALPRSHRRYNSGTPKYWDVSVEGLHFLSEQGVFANLGAEMEKDAYEKYKQWLDEKKAIAQVKSSIREKILQNLDLDSPLPSGMTLRGHQKEDVLWALDALKDDALDGVILGLDMGLGKTFISLFLARLYVKACNGDIDVVVVAPPSLIDNWKKEAIAADVEINIFSWRKIPESWHKPFIFIADEAHFAQAGYNSQQGESFMRFSRDKSIIKTFLLSGTPMKNGRPCELYPLLYAVNHPITFDKRHYDIHYCNARATKFTKWDTKGAKNLDDLHLKTQDVLRYRLKGECTDLPEKIRVFRTAEVKGASLAAYKKAYKEAEEEYQAKKQDMAAGAALTLIMRLRQAASLAKVDSTVAIAEELIAQKRPVVIFTEFIETAKILGERLDGSVMTGAVKQGDRQGYVERFQSGDSMVFIATGKVAGTGFTLTASSDVILCDRPWSPGDAQQEEDRVHRIGQNNTVMSFWIQFGEADERVDAMLEKKFERISLALKGKRKTLRGIPSKEKIALAVCKALFEKKNEELEEMMREVEDALEEDLAIAI